MKLHDLLIRLRNFRKNCTKQNSRRYRYYYDAFYVWREIYLLFPRLALINRVFPYNSANLNPSVDVICRPTHSAPRVFDDGFEIDDHYSVVKVRQCDHSIIELYCDVTLTVFAVCCMFYDFLHSFIYSLLP